MAGLSDSFYFYDLGEFTRNRKEHGLGAALKEDSRVTLARGVDNLLNSGWVIKDALIGILSYSLGTVSFAYEVASSTLKRNISRGFK
jgi:hypothetical protein